MKYINILILLLCFSLHSCSKEENDESEKEHIITLKIHSNTPESPIVLNGIGAGGYLIIKDKWEYTFSTRDYVAQLNAECNDKNVLIKGEIYVNGKLTASKEANNYINIYVILKGKPI